MNKWENQAACRDGEGRRVMADAIDYPKSDWAVPAAKAICADCPVINPCLTAHLTLKHGVVGNTNEIERARLRRRIRRAQLKKEKAAL